MRSIRDTCCFLRYVCSLLRQLPANTAEMQTGCMPSIAISFSCQVCRSNQPTQTVFLLVLSPFVERDDNVRVTIFSHPLFDAVLPAGVHVRSCLHAEQTSGNTLGSLHGIAPFTVLPWHTWTWSSPSTSCCSFCASGTCIQTAAFLPTNSTFQMVKTQLINPTMFVVAYGCFMFACLLCVSVNPPVHAWATWRVYKLTGPSTKRDKVFLARVFQKLLINFTWFVIPPRHNPWSCNFDCRFHDESGG